MNQEQLLQKSMEEQDTISRALHKDLQHELPGDWTITSQDGSLTLTPSRPWELADVSEPPIDSFRDGLLANAGSVDLHRLKAQTREVCTAPWPAAQHDVFELGAQTNFDFEIPTLRESIWQRDFRRSTGQAVEAVVQPNSSEAGAAATGRSKESARAAAENKESKKVASDAPASAAAAATSAAKRPLTKKRKSIPDIQVEEEPKRKKVAAKTKKK